MSRVIVTRQNSDGTFDEVGMNNRQVLKLKTERGIVNRLKKFNWTRRNRDTKFRLEWFHCSIGGDPHSTTFVVIPAEWPDVAELSGTDKWVIRRRLGQLHVSSSLLEAARHARPKKMRKNASRSERRAWALCVIDTWNANVNLFIGVMRPGMQKAKTNIWGKV